MKLVLPYISILVFSAFATFKFLEFTEHGQGRILSFFVSATPTPTPSPIPSPSPTSTPTPTSSPTPTLTPTPLPTPTPTPIPQPKFTSAETQGFIERFAAQYSVDPHVLRHIAFCESGFNPSAVNWPYIGLYQFGPTAWKSNRVVMGEDPSPDLRLNAEEATQTAAYLVSIGKTGIWPNCSP